MIDARFSDALAAWSAQIGNENVLAGSAAQAAFGADTTGIQRRIPAALRVRQADDLPGILQTASRHEVAVYPVSTGRNWGYGSALPARDDCVVLDLSALDRILDFDPVLGVVTVEPGVTQGQLAAFLARGGHPFLVPVTGAGPSCSLVGNALERGYGITPHADHFGAVTNLEAVLPDGSPFRTAMHEIGGARLAALVKYGIGPYMLGLFTQGGYGVVTRMSIQLAPQPECVKACLFSLRDEALLGPAVERVQRLIARLPGVVGGINLMNRHRVLAMTVPYAHDRVGTDGLLPAQLVEAWGQERQVLPWTGFATLYGTPGVVKAAAREMRRGLRGVASRVLFVSPGMASSLHGLVRRVPGRLAGRLAATLQTLAGGLELAAGIPNETALPLAYWRQQGAPAPAGARDPARDGCGLIWYAPLVPMRSGDVTGFVEFVRRVTAAHGVEPLITLTSQSDKVFDSTIPLLFDRNRPEAVARAQDCFRELFEQGRLLGYSPYRLGTGFFDLAARHQLHSSALDRRLRASLDPAGIMSPGRYDAR